MDVPRGKRVNSQDRLKNIGLNGAGLGMLGATRMAKPTSGASRKPVAVPRPIGMRDYVPVGVAGYTVETFTEFGTDVNVYSSSDGNAVVFGSKLAGDDHPRQLVYADPEGGIYWSDGTVDPAHAVNIFLWDNETVAFSSGLRVSNGPITMFGAGLGDPSLNTSAPSVVGVRGYSTANRNLITVTDTSDHYMVFDTDLGKPVWSDGSGGWVDAMGTAV